MKVQVARFVPMACSQREEQAEMPTLDSSAMIGIQQRNRAKRGLARRQPAHVCERLSEVASTPIGKPLYEELRSLGYRGSLTAFYQYLDRWRHPDTAPTAQQEQQTVQSSAAPLSSNPFELCDTKQLVWLYFRSPDELTSQEREQLLFLKLVHPTLSRAYDLVQEFVAMIRKQRGEDSEAWLCRMRTSRISEMVRFGKGIEQDKAAVLAALLLPYSNGLAEGHVHRLKLIKRQGYGRASFPLLRQRVLYQARKNA